LAYALLYLLSARFVASLAHTTYKGLGFIMGALPFVGLFILAYWAFRGLPEVKPKRKAAFEGALFCVAAYSLVSLIFRSIVNLSRYDLVYGVLGGLIVALANVYFFFTFFFLGAQLCFVVDSFDSLMFSRFRRFSAKGDIKKNELERKLFAAPERLLSKYSCSYAAGETLFAKGDTDSDIYFILSGEVVVFLDDPRGQKKLAQIHSGSFLGEMAYLLSEPRTASARAESDTVVLKLPPRLFERVLDADPETARYVIGSLSRRLKKTNERIGEA
jgi:membrane protein